MKVRVTFDSISRRTLRLSCYILSISLLFFLWKQCYNLLLRMAFITSHSPVLTMLLKPVNTDIGDSKCIKR